MWTLTDDTNRKNSGYLRISKDGVRVADVFPFAKDVDRAWVTAQAHRIVEAMNQLDMIKSGDGHGICTNQIPLPGPEH